MIMEGCKTFQKPLKILSTLPEKIKNLMTEHFPKIISNLPEKKQECFEEIELTKPVENYDLQEFEKSNPPFVEQSVNPDEIDFTMNLTNLLHRRK